MPDIPLCLLYWVGLPPPEQSIDKKSKRSVSQISFSPGRRIWYVITFSHSFTTEDEEVLVTKSEEKTWHFQSFQFFNIKPKVRDLNNNQ